MITLQPMTEEELAAFLPSAVADYARDHVADGQWLPEEAAARSREAFAALLPDGVRTAGHHLFTLVSDGGEHVGVLWFALREQQGRRTAYVYDIRIGEPFRRRGYARAAFAEMERRVRAMGAASIGLHVFGHNQGAIQLYTKLGYVPTNVVMAKPL
jgi:ribosomal protein S18 acetylase RimI-like enzyme